MRTAILLELVGCFCALVLAVTLYAITRDADPDLALLAMVCRVAEGVIGAVALPRSLGRLWLATAAGADAPDPAAAAALGAHLFQLPSPLAAGCAGPSARGRRLPSPAARRGRRKPDHGRHVDPMLVELLLASVSSGGYA